MNAAPIYLDCAATTPVDPRVIDAMNECLGADGVYANPSSGHRAGRRARERVEQARALIARRVGASPDSVIFTSGATEANNLALKGTLGLAPAGAHLVTTRIEHASVLDSAAALEATGHPATRVDCDAHGRVSPQRIAAAIRSDTALVSVMHVNNETGVVQDIAAIAEQCRARGVPLHVDAAQSVGKVAVDVSAWRADMVSLTAHKLHGPKGVGALVVRAGMPLLPLLHGGEQERGLRSGTLATHQIVGMGRAYELAAPERDGPALAALRDRLWDGLRAIEGAGLNGHPEHRAPHILNVSFAGVEGESLRLALEDLAVSAGSACASDTPDASHVLSGMGLGDALAASSLRFSVGRMTTRAEVDRAIERVASEVGRLRALAGAGTAGTPRWCSTGQIR